MEVPVNLEKANTFLDATWGLRGLLQSRRRAKKVISRLGGSGRLVTTTAQNLPDNGSRGGCIILHSPQCMSEARRWAQKRGFGERLDGFGVSKESNYLTSRGLKSRRSSAPQIGSCRSGQFKHV